VRKYELISLSFYFVRVGMTVVIATKRLF
jgi:hypothetical protein